MKKVLLMVLLISLVPGCGQEEPSTSGKVEKNLSFKCKQKIPEFTLGPYSDPSQQSLDTFCECVWGKLDGWEKETSIAIAEGRVKDISSLHMQAFPSRFGGIMESCGAGKL